MLKPFNPRYFWMMFVILFCSFLLASHLPAATISLAGQSLNNAGTNWRTDSVAKSPDVDGDDRFGTDGFQLYQADPTTGSAIETDPSNWAENIDSVNPSYISSVGSASGGMDGSQRDPGIFNLIDDWFDPNGLDIPSGYAYRTGVAANTETALLEITFTNTQLELNDVRFYLGVMYDNSSLNADQPIQLRLALVGAPLVSYSLTTQAANGVTDFSFFQLDNVSAGDQFILYGTRGSGTGNVGIGGLVFDSIAIPEPQTFILLTLSLTLLLAYQLSSKKPRSDIHL
jgi:hypothetical protein